MTTDEAVLLQAAGDVRAFAYAPYSGFRVGAAVRLHDGRVFAGANVENASFGLSVCAERHAIAAAVAGGAKPGDVQTIAIVAATSTGALSPCGACRQVFVEFADAGVAVIIHNAATQSTRRFSVGELLAEPFLPVFFHNKVGGNGDADAGETA